MHPNDHTNPAPSRPQNRSCPAGGTDRVRQDQPCASETGDRGVLVTPPSSNTSCREWPVLHRGFDTIVLSIKASIPPEVHDLFQAEKAKAEETREDVLTDFNGVPLHIKPHGGNGYAFLADGGPLGARWAFKKPNAKDPWGIRVTVGSDLLATVGLGGAKAHLEDVLDRLGIIYKTEDVSIARVDFCVDILAPRFTLIPENFVMPASTNRRDYLVTDAMQVHGKSGRVGSVTVGSQANRQAIIYDKRAEVIQHHKPQWWKIWQANLDRLIDLGQDVPVARLDPIDRTTSQVWRVEMRAGKRLLKDRWDIRTWEDLFDRIGDLFRETGELIRYCDPAPGDTNRARWPNHPLWEIACAEINDDLEEMRAGVDPQVMKEVHKETHIGLIKRNILGSSITLAALQGYDLADLRDHFTDLSGEMIHQTEKRPAHTRKQLKAAKDRYVFIRPNEPPR